MTPQDQTRSVELSLCLIRFQGQWRAPYVFGGFSGVMKNNFSILGTVTYGEIRASHVIASRLCWSHSFSYCLPFKMQIDSSMPQLDSFESLFRRTDLSKPVQKHIARVYQTLLVMVATAAVGAMVQVKYEIGGFMTFIGTFGALIWLALNPYVPNSVAAENKRTGIACLVSFFVGASIGPGLNMVYSAHGDGYVVFKTDRRPMPLVVGQNA